MSGAHPPYYRKNTTSAPLVGSRYYLCIYFPDWSIDVTRRKLHALTPSREPGAIVLTSVSSGHPVVARACPTARKAGVTPMMSLQVARAREIPPTTYYEEFDPARDTEALHTLAAWCLRFSPHVGLDVELHNARLKGTLQHVSQLHYGIVVDLTGTSRLHGDLGSLARSIHDIFKGSARVALAPTIGGAWALSRFGNNSPLITYSVSALREYAQDLPLSALRIDDVTRGHLGDVGVYTIEELLDLPRHTLAHRFGRQLICRVAQLLGSLEESFHTVTPSPRYVQRKLFEPPLVQRRAVMRAIQTLFEVLTNSLRASGVMATLFSLTLTDTTGHSSYKEFPLASATNDLKHLSSILHPIIESLRFCGELRELILEARQLASTHCEQANFSSSTTMDPAMTARSRGELLNSFSVRIGKERIAYASVEHSHIPELSCAYHRDLETATRECACEDTPRYGSLERPPVLLTPPEPITAIAMLPDKPPSRITWRNSHLTITSGIGPERIAPEWWRGDIQRDEPAARDYFRVQDAAGRWLWVFREMTTQRWFVHGVWR